MDVAAGWARVVTALSRSAGVMLTPQAQQRFPPNCGPTPTKRGRPNGSTPAPSTKRVNFQQFGLSRYPDVRTPAKLLTCRSRHRRSGHTGLVAAW